jgi:streptogramin lyase
MKLRKLPALIGVAISTMAVLFSNSPSAAHLLATSTTEVLRFDEITGAFVDVFIPLGDPDEFPRMTFGPDGALYIPVNADVLRFNGFTGTFLGVFVPEGSGGLHLPGKAVFGPDCSLYVANGGAEVLRYQGKTGDFVDVFVPPGSGGFADTLRDMVFGPDGDLYVVADGDVLRYDGRTGEFLGTFVPAGAGGLNFADHLAFGPDGNLYVSNFASQFELPRVYKFDGTTGAFLDVFGQDLGSDSFISAIAFGPDGLLYVSLLGPEAIFRYDAETGVPLGAFIQLDGVPVFSLAFTPKLDLTLIDDIVALLENARLPSGTEASLNASLRNARVAINEGRLIPAGNELNAFKNKVQANTGNLIPVPQANRMVIAADALRNTLACR